jgi:hypothetical protein
MKLAFIYNDEAWFWVLDETGRYWEAWYECTIDAKNSLTERIPKYDRTNIQRVGELMTDMAAAAQAGRDVYTYV